MIANENQHLTRFKARHGAGLMQISSFYINEAHRSRHETIICLLVVISFAKSFVDEVTETKNETLSIILSREDYKFGILLVDNN